MQINISEELTQILLYVVVPLFIICLLHGLWFCYLYYNKQNINFDSPPTYNEVVLCEKHLPKFKSTDYV